MTDRFPGHFVVPFLLLTLLYCSCVSPGHEDQEVGSKPNPYDNGRSNSFALAKVTGTTLLTNITEIGIFNTAGRVTCLLIDKADSNHLIAGAATGGLWSSSNRGITWSPVDDHLPTLNIRSLSQNPFQTNIIYASTYTSMMSGPSLNTPRPDIYKSTDGGQTFQLIPAAAGSFTLVGRVVCSPIDQNTVFATSDQNSARGVYRSQDNGQSFTLVLSLTNTVDDLEVLPDGSVLVSSGTDIYRSPGGNPGSFSLSVTGLTGPNTFMRMELAYCEGQPNNVYGVTTGGNSGVAVFRSVNGGQSWSFLQSLNSGIFTRAIGIKPNDPNYLFAGSVGLYLTKNAGASFDYYPVGGVDYWSVNFDPHNPDKVFITFDQGVVEVGLNPFNPDPYTAFKKRDSLFNCAQIYAGDFRWSGDKVLVGMQDLGTHQAFSGGTSNVLGNDGGYCFYHKQDSTKAYVSYQNGRIFKKSNLHIPFPQPGFQQPVSILNQLDMNNDNNIDEGYFFIHPFWVNNADGEQIYLPTKKRLWRSVDGALTGKLYPVIMMFSFPILQWMVIIRTTPSYTGPFQTRFG